jgi:hypothetical protein
MSLEKLVYFLRIPSPVTYMPRLFKSPLVTDRSIWQVISSDGEAPTELRSDVIPLQLELDCNWKQQRPQLDWCEPSSMCLPRPVPTANATSSGFRIGLRGVCSTCAVLRSINCVERLARRGSSCSPADPSQSHTY